MVPTLLTVPMPIPDARQSRVVPPMSPYPLKESPLHITQKRQPLQLFGMGVQVHKIHVKKMDPTVVAGDISRCRRQP